MKKSLKLFIFGCVLVSFLGLNVKAEEISDGALLETCVAEDNNVCTLVNDIEIVSTLEVSAKNVTIDLAGHKITSDVTTAIKVDSGSLVVIDSSSDSLGMIEVSGEAFRMGTKGNPNDDKDTAVLTIEKGVDVISTNDSCVVIYAGTLNTRGNLITKAGKFATIIGSGNDNGTVINITGGEVTNLANLAIYQPQDGVLTVSGGAITGTTGIEVRSGNLIVTGGIITGTNPQITINPNGNGSTTEGAGIAIAQHTTKNPIDVTISGGTIKGYSALYESDPQGTVETNSNDVVIEIVGGTFEAINGGTKAVYSEDVTGFIKGGSFSGDVTNYLASNIVLTKVSDGVYTAGTNYAVIEGENQEVKLETGKGIIFKIDADYNLFDKLYIDGKEVPKEYYTISKGSTIITLNAEYAKTLTSGNHELTVLFTDGGSATTGFKLLSDTTNPKTLDNIMIYVVTGFVSMIGLVVTAIFIKQKS